MGTTVWKAQLFYLHSFGPLIYSPSFPFIFPMFSRSVDNEPIFSNTEIKTDEPILSNTKIIFLNTEIKTNEPIHWN